MSKGSTQTQTSERVYMTKPSIILGIDPGTATTGWGVIERGEKRKSNGKKKTNNLGRLLKLVDYGCILTSKDEFMPIRLLKIRQGLIYLLKKYSPEYVVIEQLFFGVNSRTAMHVGQARGTILSTSAEYKTSIIEYQGLSVKKTLSGNGHAEKKEIAEIVKKILRMKKVPKPDDAADALAIAICHSVRLDEPKNDT